ncbi:MAG: ABC transporter substrate-binding protein [Lachnospiraceae bacterium]|nr:ABC transporter substrate-binding protein [Lachnospiraceae bacterium]
MKMKKLMALMLTGMLAVGALAGCGGSSSSSSGESAAPAEAAAEGEAAASGDATWKIGEIGPITGGAAIYGLDVAHGAELAVKEINEAGGIGGYQIEYKYEDDEHDAEKSVNAYNTLKDWGMQILLGTVTSTPCTAVAAETANDQMFQLTPSGSSLDCIANDNCFAVCFNDPQQGAKSAQYISTHFADAKIATIYDSSTPYSAGIESTFEAEAETLGLNVVVTTSFTVDSATDFSAQIQQIKDAGADFVFLPIYCTEASIILQQAADAGLAVTYFGCDGMDGILGVENFDTSLAEGLMLLTPFAADATDDLTVNFVTNFKEAYGNTPNQFGADAYDGMYALKAAIEAAGITPDASTADICEALKASIQTISVEGLTGTITWAASGEPDKEPKAVKIEGGNYVSIED